MSRWPHAVAAWWGPALTLDYASDYFLARASGAVLGMPITEFEDGNGQHALLEIIQRVYRYGHSEHHTHASYAGRGDFWVSPWRVGDVVVGVVSVWVPSEEPMTEAPPGLRPPIAAV